MLFDLAKGQQELLQVPIYQSGKKQKSVTMVMEEILVDVDLVSKIRYSTLFRFGPDKPLVMITAPNGLHPTWPSHPKSYVNLHMALFGNQTEHKHIAGVVQDGDSRKLLQANRIFSKRINTVAGKFPEYVTVEHLPNYEKFEPLRKELENMMQRNFIARQLPRSSIAECAWTGSAFQKAKSGDVYCNPDFTKDFNDRKYYYQSLILGYAGDPTVRLKDLSESEQDALCLELNSYELSDLKQMAKSDGDNGIYVKTYKRIQEFKMAAMRISNHLPSYCINCGGEMHKTTMTEITCSENCSKHYQSIFNKCKGVVEDEGMHFPKGKELEQISYNETVEGPANTVQVRARVGTSSYEPTGHYVYLRVNSDRKHKFNENVLLLVSGRTFTVLINHAGQRVFNSEKKSENSIGISLPPYLFKREKTFKNINACLYDFTDDVCIAQYGNIKKRSEGVPPKKEPGAKSTKDRVYYGATYTDIKAFIVEHIGKSAKEVEDGHYLIILEIYRKFVSDIMNRSIELESTEKELLDETDDDYQFMCKILNLHNIETSVHCPTNIKRFHELCSRMKPDTASESAKREQRRKEEREARKKPSEPIQGPEGYPDKSVLEEGEDIPETDSELKVVKVDEPPAEVEVQLTGGMLNPVTTIKGIEFDKDELAELSDPNAPDSFNFITLCEKKFEINLTLFQARQLFTTNHPNVLHFATIDGEPCTLYDVLKELNMPK